MFLALTAVFACFAAIQADNFPSLITTNATLAVIIDRDFLAEKYDKIKESIESYITYVKREILKHGGVNVQYFSWANINVKRDITAILSIASCSDTWRLFVSAEDEHLLLMAISESDCPRLPPDQAITIPLTVKGEEMPQLLLDLRTAKVYNWKTAVVLYDESLSRDLTNRVIKSLTLEASNIMTKALAVSLFKLQTNGTSIEIRNSLKATLESLSHSYVGGNFVVAVSYKLVELVMECAKSVNLVNTKNQWLYVISDTNFINQEIGHFRQLLHEGDNIAFLYNTTMMSENCAGGLQCHTEEVLTAFSRALDDAIQEEYEMAGQVSDEEWEAIRTSKVERRNALLKSVKSYLLHNGVCDNCTTWSMKSGETWGKEYQQKGPSTELIAVGHWRPSDGSLMLDELFPHIAHGFRQKTLPLLSFHNPPWQVLKINETGAVVEFRGLVFDIIKELSKNLNFTFTVDIVKTNFVYSQNYSNNSFLMEIAEITTNKIPTNMIDLIKNKTVAIGAGAFSITDRYKHFINYTSPISTQTYTFLVARPRELSRALLFMSPFTGSTWLCLAGAIVSMGPVLFYIHRYSPFYEYKGIGMKGGLASIQNCIWYMYGALLQQGGMHLPGADSARIVVGAWWLVVLVVSTTYCGNLVAFLTFPKIDIPITTIEELIAHRETVTWSVSKESFLEEQLKVAKEPRFVSLYKGRMDVEKTKQIIKNVEDGKHVFVDWKIRLQYIIKKQYMETDRCDLALGLDEFFDEQLAIIVAQDMPYLETINDEIKKLHQVGLIDKWLKDYLPKKDKCWKNRHIIKVNNHTVNLDDMQGIFFVLFLGFSLALILIMLEFLCHRYRKKKQHRKNVQPFTK